jgi:PAS domain-containing protein
VTEPRRFDDRFGCLVEHFAACDGMRLARFAGEMGRIAAATADLSRDCGSPLLSRARGGAGRYVLFVVDDDGIVLSASASCAALLRFEPHELAGMPLEAVVRPPSSPEGPYEARRRDGSRFPCELTTWPADDGRHTAVLRDLTGRHATERALREELEIAGALLHLGETLNGHLDEPYILDWVNTMALKLLGCDWSSVLGWDARRRRYRFFASAGPVRPDVHELCRRSRCCRTSCRCCARSSPAR